MSRRYYNTEPSPELPTNSPGGIFEGVVAAALKYRPPKEIELSITGQNAEDKLGRSSFRLGPEEIQSIAEGVDDYGRDPRAPDSPADYLDALVFRQLMDLDPSSSLDPDRFGDDHNLS